MRLPLTLGRYTEPSRLAALLLCTALMPMAMAQSTMKPRPQPASKAAQKPSDQKDSKPPAPAPPAPAPNPADEFTGMYSFVNEGDYVQLAVETENPLPNDGGYRVSGYVSRLGDDSTDKGMVLDHLITGGTLKGEEMEFTTRTIHGVSFAFKGKVRRGTVKNRKDDGYYEIAGELTRTQTTQSGGEKKTASRAREVVMKLFGEIDDVEEDDKN